MPHGQNTKTKQKQYCNEDSKVFSKDFKNGPHEIKIFKKKKNPSTHWHSGHVTGEDVAIKSMSGGLALAVDWSEC